MRKTLLLRSFRLRASLNCNLMDLSIPLLLYTGARKLRGIPLATNRLLVMQRTFTTTLHLVDAGSQGRPTTNRRVFWTDSKLENCRFESQRMSCLEHFDQTLEKFFKANGSITSDNI